MNLRPSGYEPYAGHGLQVGGQNYLVPIDAKLTTASAVDFEMVRLDLVHRTMEREAGTSILMMDACRDNPLARNRARALGTRSTQIGRGLTVVESGEGTLISFSTQPGNVALDGTGRNSPYATALLKHIATPGDDLPTILINVRNDVMQETARRQVPWEHSAMTAKFYFTPPRPTTQQIEFQFWTSVKDSTNPAVLGTYLERHPTGEYAPIARVLIDHYDRQIKLDVAAREGERKRQEEEMRAAEARRLEDEQRAREEALATERKRAEEAKSTAEIKRLDEQAKTEWMVRTEEPRKALEEARLAREAAKAAEEKRLAAVRAAEEATKAAEQTIVAKREADRTGDPVKLAALPKVEGPRPSGHFDGNWQVHRLGPSCPKSDVRFKISVTNGVVSGHLGGGPISGKVTSSGQFSFRHLSSYPGFSLQYSGNPRINSGSGTFNSPETPCNGTIALSKGL